MGEQKVSLLKDKQQMHRFIRNLLNDVTALQYMIDNDYFEKDIVRIGAEQEMAIVDKHTFKAAPIAMDVIARMKKYDWLETELASFNLEINLDPHEFTGYCLSKLYKEVTEKLNIIREHVAKMDAKIILTGILPTLRKFDMVLDNLTPKKRYAAIMKAINEQLLGSAYELRLYGVDELQVKHDSPMLEACNTSFQVHLQVTPDNFVQYYNISQVLVAPVMAAAANSSLVFGRRLWHESRIALFQQALDTRSTHDHLRQRSPRVNFGDDWLKNSILEIYKEDIARFRVLISGDQEEDSLSVLNNGKVPKLRALQVHNSTVYRWNRPCYGISPNGKPHLRIENRVMPAGPTVLDEVANAAFWLGAMIGLGLKHKDITKYISFSDAKDNFAKGARYGLDTKFTWLKDEKITAAELILTKLIPIARKGLLSQKVAKRDINRFLSIIETRVKNHMNGARWLLRSFTELKEHAANDEALSVLTASIIKNQEKEIPVHKWKQPKATDLANYRPSNLKVEEFMTTDLFTARKEDLIDMVSEILLWRAIRYMPVEDSKGNLVGLITSRKLLQHYAETGSPLAKDNKIAEDIMIKKPISIQPEATILDAMKIMKDNKIGCLPVTRGKELIGIITEMDFLRISSRLMERLEKE